MRRRCLWAAVHGTRGKLQLFLLGGIHERCWWPLQSIRWVFDSSENNFQLCMCLYMMLSLWMDVFHIRPLIPWNYLLLPNVSRKFMDDELASCPLSSCVLHGFHSVSRYNASSMNSMCIMLYKISSTLNKGIYYTKLTKRNFVKPLFRYFTFTLFSDTYSIKFVLQHWWDITKSKVTLVLSRNMSGENHHN